MKDIDYEAIVKEAAKRRGWPPVSTEYVKAIIEAYEAQKTQPEWVPLDLATVKQGQEVRHATWRPGAFGYLACRHKDGFIWVTKMDTPNTSSDADDWLMRAPKPKTVTVMIHRRENGDLIPFIVDVAGDRSWDVVGKGEIKVRE